MFLCHSATGGIFGLSYEPRNYIVGIYDLSEKEDNSLFPSFQLVNFSTYQLLIYLFLTTITFATFLSPP
jgi:hypothetical protein